MEFRRPLFKNAEIAEAAFPQNLGGPLKMRADILGVVGIGAHGDNFPAQLPVALQQAHAGMKVAHAAF